MFTGLIEETGRVASVAPTRAGARLTIACETVLDGLTIGDSVAVNGACLTAVAHDAAGFSVEAVAETLRRTALGALSADAPVNLERAMRLGDRLGGHIVQGHVDGTGVVRAVQPEGESLLMTISADADLLRYVVTKGSITVDGVSLTVAERLPDGFSLALIPHTQATTTLGPGAIDRRVNLEVDVVAKYVAMLARPYLPSGGE